MSPAPEVCRIPSDPELEIQINDRISFKKFLGLPFDMPSPDHSTFSRFRKRLSEKTMTKINNEVLLQFSHQGLSINEGIAVDARLVQSASRPIGKEKIKEEREKKVNFRRKHRQDRKATKILLGSGIGLDYQECQTSLWSQGTCLC